MRNKIQLIGHLGQDVDIKEVNGGKMVAKISVATNDYYKNPKGERQKTTQWHNCVAWGRTAKNMERILKKGKKVAIQGKLVYNNWEDKNGIKRYQSQIWIQEFIALN